MVCIRTAYRCGGHVSRRDGNISSSSSSSGGSHPSSSSILLSSRRAVVITCTTMMATLRCPFAPLSSSFNSTSSLYSFSNSPPLHPSFSFSFSFSLNPSSLSAASSSSTLLCCSRRFFLPSSSTTTEKEKNKTKEGRGDGRKAGGDATEAKGDTTTAARVNKVAVEATSSAEETTKIGFPKRLAPTWGTISRCQQAAVIDDGGSTHNLGRRSISPVDGGNRPEKGKQTVVVGGTRRSPPPPPQPLHTTADAGATASARAQQQQQQQKEGPSAPLASTSSPPPPLPSITSPPHLSKEKEGGTKNTSSSSSMPSEEKEMKNGNEKEKQIFAKDLLLGAKSDTTTCTSSDSGTNSEGSGSTAEEEGENETDQATEEGLLRAAESSSSIIIGKITDKADLPHRLQIVEELRASLAVEEERTKSGPVSPLLKKLRAVDDENEKQQSEKLDGKEEEKEKEEELVSVASDQKSAAESTTTTAAMNEKANDSNPKAEEKEKESKEKATLTLVEKQKEELDEVFDEAIGCESRQFKREVIAGIIGDERVLIDSERARLDLSRNSNVSGSVINKDNSTCGENGGSAGTVSASVNASATAVIGQTDPNTICISNSRSSTSSNTKLTTASAETAAATSTPRAFSSDCIDNRQAYSSSLAAETTAQTTHTTNNTMSSGSGDKQKPAAASTSVPTATAATTKTNTNTNGEEHDANTNRNSTEVLKKEQQEQQQQRVKAILRLALGGGNEAAGQTLLTRLLGQKLEKEGANRGGGGRTTATNNNSFSSASSPSSWPSFEFGLARGNHGPLTPVSVINPTAWGPNNKKGFCKEHTTQQKVELLKALGYSYPNTSMMYTTSTPSPLSATTPSQKGGDLPSVVSCSGSGDANETADETDGEFADENENSCGDTTTASSSSPFSYDYDPPLPPAPPELIASLRVLPEDDLSISVEPRTGKPRVAPRSVRMPSKLIARHVYGSNTNNVNSSRNQGHYFPPSSLAHQSPFQSQNGRVGGGANGSSGGGVAARRWGASAATAAAFAASVAASQQRIPNPTFSPTSSSSFGSSSPSTTPPTPTPPNPYNNHNYFDWVDIQSHPTATLHEYLTSLASLLVDLDIHESLVSTALDNVVLPQFSVAEGGCYSLVLRSVSEELLNAGDIIIASASISDSVTSGGGGGSRSAEASRVGSSPAATPKEDRQEVSTTPSTTVVRMSSIVGRLSAFVGSFFSFDSASPSFIDVPQYGATGGGVGLGKKGSRTREGSCSPPNNIPSSSSSSSSSTSPSPSSSSSFLAASTDSFNARAILEMDTIQELTNRITIIALPEMGRIITIHRAPMPFIDEILGDWWGIGGDTANNNNYMTGTVSGGAAADGHARFATIDYVTSLLTHEAVRSYHQAVSQAIIQFDSLEARLFVPQKQRAVLAREIYHVKRRASVFSRSLQLIHESYASMCGALGVSHYDSSFREVSQELIHVRSLSDELGENATTVLSLLFQLSSYQLNGLMRVLTLFSAFFIPLTFIASVCGMNFDTIGIGYLGTVTCGESDDGTATEKPLYRLMIKDENGWNQWLVGSSMVGSALGLMVTFRLRGLL